MSKDSDDCEIMNELFDSGQGDFYATGFIASKNNHQIKGTVCSRLLYKNATIRFE